MPCSLTAALSACPDSPRAVRAVLTHVTTGFQPRLPGLTKLMARFAKDGRWQKSLCIFDALPLLGLTPDTTVANAAIAACDRGGQWPRALAIFAGMREHGPCRDTITFSSTISARSKSRRAHMAVEVCCSSPVHTCGTRAADCTAAASRFVRLAAWRVFTRCCRPEERKLRNAHCAALLRRYL